MYFKLLLSMVLESEQLRVYSVLKTAIICFLVVGFAACAPEIENYSRFGLIEDDNGELVDVATIRISDSTDTIEDITACESIAENPTDYIETNCQGCHADDSDKPLSRESLLSAGVCDAPLYNPDDPSNSLLLEIFAGNSDCDLGGVMPSIIQNVSNSPAEVDCLQRWVMGLE